MSPLALLSFESVFDLSSSFFSASAFSLLFAAGLASVELAGLASLVLAGFASPAEPAFALADAGYYADAYMAACIYASSSSIPFAEINQST